MKNKLLAMLLAAAMLLSLCACGTTPAEPAAVTAETTTVTDLIDREVEVTPGQYSRVVCIGAGALRMYSYVGDVSLLCGVEDIDNESLDERPAMFDATARPYVMAYGDVFDALPSCGVGGPNAQTAEAERILACDPEIVLSFYGDVEKADALQQQLGVPVITLKSGPKGVFDDAFKASLTLLGALFGREEQVQALLSFIDSETAEITSRTADVAEGDRPNVYICGLGNWGTTDYLTTSPNYASFAVANVKNAMADLTEIGVQPIEEEKFVSAGEDMDMVFVDAAAIKNIKPLYQSDPTIFDTCRAWCDGEVYLQMAFNAYYTNYEIMLLNTWFIAKTVYPDLFVDVDLTAKADEITTAFLGKALGQEIFDCPASYGGYRQIDGDFFAG